MSLSQGSSVYSMIEKGSLKEKRGNPWSKNTAVYCIIIKERLEMWTNNSACICLCLPVGNGSIIHCFSWQMCQMNKKLKLGFLQYTGR